MQVVKLRAGDVTAKLIAEGDRICQSVLAGKPFETDTLQLWAGMCRRGGSVLDVGAYTGLFSIVARLRGARALAFEPMPFNRERFKANCNLNRVSSKVNAEAVSDVVGLDVVHYNPIPFTSGASLLRRTGAALTVRVLTIDSLGLQRLDAVKIDVERAEAQVLRGAVKTLARLRPQLIVEVLDEQRAEEVSKVLGGEYRLAAKLDTRNWHLEPR